MVNVTRLDTRLKKDSQTMICRQGCGACCIAPSINSWIPGMPNGKPAGERCAQLSDDNLCKLFGKPDRPGFCVNLKASAEMCGASQQEAIRYLSKLELSTRP